MTDITLVIPAKFEKHSLPLVLEELKKFSYKIIIVLQENDIETIQSIKGYDCEILYQKNKGYGDALINGINNTKTQYFCIFNADGSFNPAEINNMHKKLKQENLEFVFASRYQKNSGSDDDTIITYFGNFFFTFLGKLLFKLNISDILYTFVLGKTEECKKLKLQRKDFTFCIELPVKSKLMNFKINSIESFERKRLAGFKKVNEFKDVFLILIYMIKLFCISRFK